jgi:predicted dehydrogenase
MNQSTFRIGIIGIDSSHAPTFTQLLNDKDHPFHVAGGKVTIAYPGGSPDFEMSYSRIEGFTAQLRERGVEIVDSPEEVAANCDGILMTSVDGRIHLEQFRRVASYRRPIFIDKPMTVSSAKASEIFTIAQENNIPIMSCSSLRYAEELTIALEASDTSSNIIGMDCYGPMALQPTQPGLFWYGVHTVEMLFRALGKGCLHVTATTTEEHDLITGVWGNGVIGTIRGNRKGNGQFGALLHRESHTQFVDVNKHPKPYYASLLEKIMTMFVSATPDIDGEETLQIIRFMEAANESRETGLTVNL